MFSLLRIFVWSAFCVVLYNADDLQVGTSTNSQLAYTENVRLAAVPLTARTKNVFYNSNTTAIIKAINVIDIDRSKASVSITAGGVGFLYANVRMKSERGSGLNYLVQIFV